MFIALRALTEPSVIHGWCPRGWPGAHSDRAQTDKTGWGLLRPPDGRSAHRPGLLGAARTSAGGSRACPAPPAAIAQEREDAAFSMRSAWDLRCAWSGRRACASCATRGIPHQSKAPRRTWLQWPIASPDDMAIKARVLPQRSGRTIERTCAAPISSKQRALAMAAVA